MFLSDEKIGKPILHLEQLYPKNISKKFAIALIEHAISESQRIKAPLRFSPSLEVYTKFKFKPSSPVGCSCVNDLAPYEYVDAGNGVAEGTYTINSTLELERPVVS